MRIRMPAAALLILLLSTGCSGPLDPLTARRGIASSADGTNPDIGGAGALLGTGSRDFYPLRVGHRWRYQERYVATFVDGDDDDDDDGAAGGPTPPAATSATVDLEQICLEERSGIRYLVERIRRTTVTDAGAVAGDAWVRYRQNDGGLFEADVALDVPPVCASPDAAPAISSTVGIGIASALGSAMRRPGQSAAGLSAQSVARLEQRIALIQDLARNVSGSRSPTAGEALSDEILRLDYPLRAEAKWTIRSDPRITATVEGVEVLTLPTGALPTWRIRLDVPVTGVMFVRAWYGRVGLVMAAARTEVETDEGRLLLDYSQTLESFAPAGEGGS